VSARHAPAGLLLQIIVRATVALTETIPHKLKLSGAGNGNSGGNNQSGNNPSGSGEAVRHSGRGSNNKGNSGSGNGDSGSADHTHPHRKEAAAELANAGQSKAPANAPHSVHGGRLGAKPEGGGTGSDESGGISFLPFYSIFEKSPVAHLVFILAQLRVSGHCLSN
jgi:hypothetical protein